MYCSMLLRGTSLEALYGRPEGAIRCKELLQHRWENSPPLHRERQYDLRAIEVARTGYPSHITSISARSLSDIDNSSRWRMEAPGHRLVATLRPIVGVRFEAFKTANRDRDGQSTTSHLLSE
jgi:hypothetical protein